MPFNGLTSFLRDNTEDNTGDNTGCQCPLTGYIRFYAGGNSYIGNNSMCQCPLTGYLLFYMPKADYPAQVMSCVNAL